MKQKSGKQDKYFPNQANITICQSQTSQENYSLYPSWASTQPIKRIVHHGKVRLSKYKRLFQHSQSTNVIYHINKIKTRLSEMM